MTYLAAGLFKAAESALRQRESVAVAEAINQQRLEENEMRKAEELVQAPETIATTPVAGNQTVVDIQNGFQVQRFLCNKENVWGRTTDCCMGEICARGQSC